MKKVILTLLICCYGFLLTAQTYHVGDLYTAPDGSQGIVYYILPDGSGGWVVALEDASPSCAWGETLNVPGLNDSDFDPWPLLNDHDGYSNTQILRSFQNNNPAFAAGKVDFANGWYLPSPHQLITLYARLPLITAALSQAGGTNLGTDRYWCSAERHDSQAWTVDFGVAGNNGAFTDLMKTAYARVRAVRSFDYISEGLSYQWSTGAATPSISVSPTQTTNYTVTVTAAGGGNATVVRTVEVKESPVSEFTVAATGSYTWNGVTYNESGNYTQTFTAANQCDSVVTLHLTVTLALETEVTVTDDTICAGEQVTLEAVALNPDDFIAPPTPPAVAVGDILCTDGTTVKPSAYAASGKTAMGIVLYVNNSGHGWAINLHEQGPMAWSTAQSGSIPNAIVQDSPAEAISDYNGSYNTYAIRTVSNPSLYPAAMAVDYDNGWYLPASGQLYLMYPLIPILNESLAICGGTLFDFNSSWYYCSSTVALARNMWSLDDDGNIIHYLPGLSYNVRSMRNF